MQEISSPSAFSLLPIECQLQVFQHLDHSSILNVSGVCKEWNAISKDDSIWQKFKDRIPPYLKKIPDTSCYQYCIDYLKTSNVNDIFPYRKVIYTSERKNITIWKLKEQTDSSAAPEYACYEIPTDHAKRITAFHPSFNVKGTFPVQLLTGSADGTIKIWIPKDDDNLQCIGTLNDLEAENGVTTLKLAEDKIYSGFRDGTIKIWVPHDDSGQRMYECSHSFKGHNGTITSLQMNNREFYTGSIDGTIKIWETYPERKYVLKQTLISTKERVSALIWNARDAQLLSASEDKIIVWDFNTEKQFKVHQIIYAGHKVTSMLKPYFNGILLTAGEDGTVKKFLKKDGKYIHESDLAVTDQIITAFKFGFKLNTHNYRQVYTVSLQDVIKQFEQSVGKQDYELKETWSSRK